MPATCGTNRRATTAPSAGSERGVPLAGNEGYYCPQCLHTMPGAALRPQRHRQRGITSTLLVCPACQLVLASVVEIV